MEESSPSFSCMDKAYGYGSLPTPKIAENKVQETETLHFRYMKLLVDPDIAHGRQFPFMGI